MGDTEEYVILAFETLCGAIEPIAMQTFRIAPRAARYRMVEAAASQYDHLLIDDEAAQLQLALRRLDKLASVRNEIAHGYILHIGYTENGEQKANGYHLIPSMQEDAFASVEPHYHHTPASILLWIEELRAPRATIAVIGRALRRRLETRRNHTGHSYDLEITARRIVNGRLVGIQAIEAMRELIADYDEFPDAAPYHGARSRTNPEVPNADHEKS